jgi:hypothetical protein
MPLLPVNRAENSTRGSRKISGQRVSGGDAPVVNPGVARAAPLNAPAGAFDSGLTAVTQEISPGLDVINAQVEKRKKANDAQLAAAAEKQVTRQDILARVNVKRSYREASEAYTKKFTSENDISTKEGSAAFRKGVIQLREDILSKYEGSSDGLARSTQDVDQMEGSVFAKMGEKQTQINLAKVDEEVERDLAPLDTEITPTSTIDDFDEIVTKGYAIIDGYAPGEQEETTIERKRLHREGVATQLIEKALFGGDPGRAEIVFKSDKIIKSLSKEKRTELRRKIETAFKEAKNTKLELDTFREKERIKHTVKKESIKEVLGGLGINDPQEGSNIETASIANPLGAGVETSPDFIDAMRSFEAARKLFAAGYTSEANGYLSTARFMIENSSDIKAQKELDKPLSIEAATALGVPVGTTMRSVMGQIPVTPEESAKLKAKGAATGAAEIKGEETIAFIDEADGTITDLLEDLKIDPKLVGAVGSFRATGQNISGLLTDIGADDIISQATDIAFEGTDMSLDEQNSFFDNDNLSVLSVMENSIGLILARLRTPTGRIPVDVIKRSIKDVNLTGLNSSRQIMDRLRFVQKQLHKRRDSIKKRFAPPGTNDKASTQATHRIVEGKLVKIGSEGDSGSKKK